MTRMFTPGRLSAVVVAGVMFVGLSLPASAFMITQLADFDKGTPCDAVTPPAGACDLFEVSGLTTGDSFNMDWIFASGVDVVDVSGTFTVDSLIGDTMRVTVTMTNSSSSTGAITSLGLTTGSDLLAVSSSLVTAGTFFDMFAIDPTMGLGSEFDACIFSTSCFTGSVLGGLPDGFSDTFTVDLVALDGTFDGTLDHFVIKFQGQESFEKPGTPVPEPSTLLLFATGLLGLGVLARRRRTA